MADATDTITGALKDAAYITIGLGVMGVQRAQVARRELAKQFGQGRKDSQSNVAGSFEDARGQWAKLAKQVDDLWAPVTKQVDERLDQVEDRLPSPVADIMKQTRSATKAAQDQVRSLAGIK